MSTERVLDETLERAARIGLRHACTSPILDIDRVADLDVLFAMTEQEPSDRCARTVSAIADWRKRAVL